MDLTVDEMWKYRAWDNDMVDLDDLAEVVKARYDKEARRRAQEQDVKRSQRDRENAWNEHEQERRRAFFEGNGTEGEGARET